MKLKDFQHKSKILIITLKCSDNRCIFSREGASFLLRLSAFRVITDIMELFSLGGKKHISIKPYRNSCLWSIEFKAEASTHPQTSVLKNQMCKYTQLACTPH